VLPVIAPLVAVALSVVPAVAVSDTESVLVGVVMLACESLMLPAVASVAESDSEFEPSVTVVEVELGPPAVLLLPSVAPAVAVVVPPSPQAVSVVVIAIAAAATLQIRRSRRVRSAVRIYSLVFMVVTSTRTIGTAGPRDEFARRCH
jgi:hypothetical protein